MSNQQVIMPKSMSTLGLQDTRTSAQIRKRWGVSKRTEGSFFSRGIVAQRQRDFLQRFGGASSFDMDDAGKEPWSGAGSIALMPVRADGKPVTEPTTFTFGGQSFIHNGQLEGGKPTPIKIISSEFTKEKFLDIKARRERAQKEATLLIDMGDDFAEFALSPIAISLMKGKEQGPYFDALKLDPVTYGTLPCMPTDIISIPGSHVLYGVRVTKLLRILEQHPMHLDDDIDKIVNEAGVKAPSGGDSSLPTLGNPDTLGGGIKSKRDKEN
jgi:hypothetical protein